jgi:hypothetical protein
MNVAAPGVAHWPTVLLLITPEGHQMVFLSQNPRFIPAANLPASNHFSSAGSHV